MSFPNVDLKNPVAFLTPFGPRTINEVALDVVVNESVEHTVAVTDSPIEVGADGFAFGTASDHAYNEPIVYTMTGGVSDIPISWRVFQNRYGNATADTRSNSAYELLVRHLEERVPFTLATPLRDYENMLFTRLRVDRDKSTKSAILFSAEMKQLITVRPTNEPLPVTRETVAGEQAESRAIPEINAGEVSGREVSDPTILSRIFSIFGGS